MFGMPSTEFWEDDPQLYWAYRFSYEKAEEFRQKKEVEQQKFGCWLQGMANEIGVSIALNNAFSKKKQKYPTYKEFYKQGNDAQINEELASRLKGVTDKNKRSAIEFNYWARI